MLKIIIGIFLAFVVFIGILAGLKARRDEKVRKHLSGRVKFNEK